MTGFSFGSYCPQDSVLHRLDPRVKLVLGLLYLIVLLAAGSWAALAAAAVFVVACYVLSHVPVRRAISSVAPLMGIVVLVALLRLFTDQGGAVLWHLGPLAIFETGVRSAAFTAARLALMMAGMSLVTLTTPTLDLTAGFERLLAPLARFGLPAHELGMILGLALRFMPQLADELKATYEAQVSRGARRSSGPLGAVRMLTSVAVPLFAGVFRHAESLSAAMEARCYHGEQGRTRLHPLRCGRADVVAVAAFAVFALVVLLLR